MVPQQRKMYEDNAFPESKPQLMRSDKGSMLSSMRLTDQ